MVVLAHPPCIDVCLNHGPRWAWLFRLLVRDYRNILGNDSHRDRLFAFWAPQHVVSRPLGRYRWRDSNLCHYNPVSTASPTGILNRKACQVQVRSASFSCHNLRAGLLLVLNCGLPEPVIVIVGLHVIEKNLRSVSDTKKSYDSHASRYDAVRFGTPGGKHVYNMEREFAARF